MPRYFAEGGPVGFAGGGFATPESAGGVTIQVNVDGSDLLSDAAIDKRVIPRIERALKQAGVLPR